MPRLSLIGVTLLLAIQAGQAIAVDLTPVMNKPLRIGGIKLMDDGLLGTHHLKRFTVTDPSPLPLPHFYYSRYVWDGTHLRIHPGEDDKRVWSKEAAAKDGWYVTADYSTSPPRVIVTKEPTKYSAWQFVRGSQAGFYYIKNENDLGKDAWLGLEDTGKLYSHVQKVPVTPGASAEFNIRYWEGNVSTAILSFKNRTTFLVVELGRQDRR